MIELRNVSVRFGSVDAVSDVSLAVETGEWTALIGPNGAGKTSVLRAMCRLVAFGGDIELDGRNIRQMSRREVARVIAFVPQTPVTPLELTVAEYVLLGRTPYLAYRGDEGPDDRLAAQRALDRLQLRPFADRALGSLSGGELQRVVLARALAQEAPILLLDEPTTALDPQARHLVWDRLYRLKLRGTTLVLTTHYMDEAEQLCDRLVVMDHARIVAAGTPASLIAEYSSREVVELRFAPDDARVGPSTFAGIAERVEVLPDRVLLYSADGEATVEAVHARGITPLSVLVRRSTLEDVFLRLTGRSLVE
jgi:lipooligosaccharide transport system ATP-binding protein